MSQGIMLITFGRRGYSYAAYNLAFSIKFYNPAINITLYHDSQTFSHIKDDCFDKKILLSDDQIAPNGFIDPCFLKTRLYDLCPYDETIFLDVDALCFKDIQPIFDDMNGVDYMTHIYDSHTIDKGRDFPEMIWAWCDEIWSHFNMKDTDILPATNSSIQYFRKGKKCKALWDQVKANYANKIPLNKLRSHWGGTQPDELYLNVALAQLGWDQHKHYMFLGDKHSKLSLKEIEENYYFLSIYGGRGYTKLVYTQWYDRIRQKKLKTHYKVDQIINDKHCNTKSKDPIRNGSTKHVEVVLEKSLIPLDKTVLIPSSQLLQTYLDPKGKTIRVTNWFNCSFIEHHGKTVFVYRMEAYPFCSYTKLGICYLDKNLIPIKDSNKLLNLHSDLKGYSKGFHVEDPRLFVFNDQLYLSYCDGYQMAQATINHETLEASDSFYIEKPNKNKTEKNWTFFQHKKDLYSVYEIAPHKVFRMNGSKFEKVFEQPFKNNWKWGELRGGTSPILTDDGYISFFHSSIDHPGNVRQYFIGVYLFDKEPPFTPLAISKEPILCGEMISPSIPRLSNKIYVVFPGGVIKTDTGYLVSYGFNDYQSRYVEVPNKFIVENMISINEHSRI